MPRIINVAPERYIAPRKRECSGGTVKGSTRFTSFGKNMPQIPT
jgi:hypothetical protein